jgi:Mce-associated membrane protein
VSPRRRFEPGGGLLFPAPLRRRRWGLPLTATLCAAVVAAAVTLCTLVLMSHQTLWGTTIKDAAALGYVHSFMTEFTSPDPFHANDYTDRVLAQATGSFAEQYRENQNQILVQVARSEPTTGTVLDAGVERWNDDGSVDILVITKFTSKSPDGKLALDRESRWIVTAKQEGDRWKISGLIPMI